MRRIVTASMALSLAASLLLFGGGHASANALAGGGFSSSYAGESVFTNKAAGESGQFSVIFFNDGTQTWSPGVVGLLICLADKTTCNVASPNAAYASGWTSTTVYATVSATVAPGQNGFFIYNFVVPAGTAPGTAATFNGDVGLIATGTMLRPEGYFQINTTPAATGALTISPTSASLPVGGQQQFTATGAPTGSTVAWSVTGGCGAVTAGGLFAATAVNSPTQPCTVVATAGGLTASASITVFGPATQIICSASKTSIVGNGSSTSVISGTLRDANSNVVANAQGTNITFSNVTPALLTPIAAETIGTTNGVSSKTYTSVINTTGTAQVSLTSASITGCTQAVTITAPGAATTLSASLSPTTIAADGLSNSRLRVEVRDADNNRVTGDNTTIITISRTSGASVCIPGSDGGTAALGQVGSGRKDFTITSTTTPGTCTYDITANVTTISGTTATLTTIIVGAPSQLSASVSGSPAVVSAVGGGCVATDVSCPTVTVTMRDAAGNRVTGALGQGITITATWTTSTTAGTGCPAGMTANSASTGALIGGSGSTRTTGTTTTTQGTASFQFVSTLATTGCTITFSDGLGVTSTTAVVAFNPGPATGVACTFTPRVIFNNGSSTSISTVNVVDANGNATGVGSFSTTFGISPADAGGTVTTLVTTSPQTMTNGTVQFTVRSTTTAGTDTYRASANVTGDGTAETGDCDITTAASLTNF